MQKLHIGCVVMAAGNATRFGENKLACVWNGKTLIQHALDAVPAEQFDHVVVVTQYPEVAQMAQTYGFSVIENQHPDWGISHTISLGLRELSHMDAVLFQVSDQPQLSRRSVADLVRCYRQHPHNIVALCHNGVRGNPCLFPRQYFPELLELQEDHGGNTVIRRHEDALLLYEVAASELTDVDTPEALKKLES